VNIHDDFNLFFHQQLYRKILENALRKMQVIKKRKADKNHFTNKGWKKNNEYHRKFSANLFKGINVPIEPIITDMFSMNAVNNVNLNMITYMKVYVMSLLKKGCALFESGASCFIFMLF